MDPEVYYCVHGNSRPDLSRISLIQPIPSRSVHVTSINNRISCLERKKSVGLYDHHDVCESIVPCRPFVHCKRQTPIIFSLLSIVSSSGHERIFSHTHFQGIILYLLYVCSATIWTFTKQYGWKTHAMYCAFSYIEFHART